MALSQREIEDIERLHQKLNQRWALDEKNYLYVTLQQRIEQLGMAIPPSMRRFLVVSNWCRVVVRTIVSRQQERSLILPGESFADDLLHQIWDNSNMWSRSKQFRRDYLTYGRGFLSVFAGQGLPVVRPESPRQTEVDVDTATGETLSAALFRRGDQGLTIPSSVTLLYPDYSVRAVRDGARWVETWRDDHRKGAVPLVGHFNESWSEGVDTGESELTDIIPLVDSVARSLTNLQFAQEAHGIPRMWMAGVSKQDFIDPTTGQPIPLFEAYFDAIHMLSNAQGKVGQLTAADLKNFETAVRVYGQQASIVTGFPARYFGLTTSNPATEGAIIADEIQLVSNVEDKNQAESMPLGWVAGLAYEYATGRKVEGNRIKVEYHNPATPTIAQREDALTKRRGMGIISREGYWDELGWSEARKARERENLRLEAEQNAEFLIGAAVKPDVESEPAEVG